MAKRDKKGKPGPDNNDSGSGGGLTGSNRNDNLDGGGGGVINGRRGFDTVTYEGSVWDYTFGYDSSGFLTISNGSTTDTLRNIEFFSFDDFQYEIGSDNAPQIMIEPIVVRAGGSTTFSATFFDADSSTGSFLFYSETSADFQLLSRTSEQFFDGERVTLTWQMDVDSGFAPLSLAEGETYTRTVQTSNFGDRKVIMGKGIHEVTIIGANDAPVLTGSYGTPEALYQLDASEDGGAVSLDLLEQLYDVDSDDSAETLSLRIVSADPRLNVSTAGSVLTFYPGSDFQDLSSDEALTFEIGIVAVDSHGAESEVRFVTLTVNGTQDLPPNLFTDGGIDFAAVGIDFSAAAGPFLSAHETTPAEQAELFPFDEGNDIFVFEGNVFAAFGTGWQTDPATGERITVDRSISFGDGNDIAAFRFTPGAFRDGQVFFEFNEIDMGNGEDVLAIQMRSDNGASLINNKIWMGADDDRFYLDIQVDGPVTLFSTDVWMGAGDDLAVVRAASFSQADQFVGSLTIGNSYDLGSGNDTFIFEVALEQSVYASFDARIDASYGDDYVLLDNRNSTPDALLDYEYEETGFNGSVDLGNDDDVLDFFLIAQSYESSNGFLDGGSGYDVLNVGYRSDEVTGFDSGGDAGRFRFEADGQILDVWRFEEINFADGVSLYVDYAV